MSKMWFTCCIYIGATAVVGAGAAIASAEDTIPSKYLQDQTIQVASSATSPPFIFFDKDGSTIIGVDVEIANAIAKRLGLTAKFVSLNGFAGIIPAIQTARYPIALSAMTDNEKRRQIVDFLDYANVGLGLVVAAGNPKHIEGPGDLCGKTLATETGSSAIEIGNKQSKICEAKGAQPVNVVVFPSEAQAQLQVKTGRADANVHDYPVAIYTAQHSGGELSASKANFCKAPFGIAVMKGKPELLNPLHNALSSVISSPDYKAILSKWGMEAVAIEKVAVNGDGLAADADPICQ